MLKAFVTRKRKNNKNQAKQARQVCLHESHPHFPLILLPEAFPSFGSREKWKIFKACGKKLIPTNVIMLCVCVLRVEFLHADFGLPRRQSFCQCLIGSELFLPLTLHTSQHIACVLVRYVCTSVLLDRIRKYGMFAAGKISERAVPSVNCRRKVLV